MESSMPQTGHGLILGKFLPPHNGHLHLCRAAQRMCDELVVVVGSLQSEPASPATAIIRPAAGGPSRRPFKRR